MLEDAAGIRRVVLACGTVDLRKGIDGLAMIIGDKYNQNWNLLCHGQRPCRLIVTVSVAGERRLLL